MLPSEARQNGRGAARPRRRPTRTLAPPERLEGRELLAYTPLGFSLPDLTVTGYSAPLATWGGGLSVTVDVRNLGASSLTEPYGLAQATNNPSTADAPASTVAVFISPRYHGGPRVFVGTLSIPALSQNSLAHVTGFLPMPQRQPGFPSFGGNVFVSFTVDPGQNVPDNDRTNNFYVAPQPVRIAPDLPDLQAVALDVPPVMQPGDVIQPSIRIENIGTAASGSQGPVEVDLVVSNDTTFGPGDQVIQQYTLPDLLPLSAVPMTDVALGDVNVTPTANIATLIGAPVQLPNRPGPYYLGVVIDPNNTIPMLNGSGLAASGRGFGHRQSRFGQPVKTLEQVRQVGPSIPNLPPATQVGNPAAAINLPTVPPFGRVKPNTAVGLVPAAQFFFGPFPGS